MIQEFVESFMKNKHELVKKYSLQHPDGNTDIVRDVVELLQTDGYDSIDPSRIHIVDDGDYQGTLLYIIAAIGYQPSTYWYVKVGYGSCSGCDTFQSIRYDPWDDIPTNEQTEGYMTMALHVVQGLKAMQ